MIEILLALTVLVVILQIKIFLLHRRLKLKDDNRFYTDYAHGNLVLRVFKPEFEFQAYDTIPTGKVRDSGNLSQFYMWVLFEKG